MPGSSDWEEESLESPWGRARLGREYQPILSPPGASPSPPSAPRISCIANRSIMALEELILRGKLL